MGDPNILIRKLKDREENPDLWSDDHEYDMRVGEDDKRCACAIKGAYMDHSKLRFCVECCFKKPLCAEPIHSPCVNPARRETVESVEELKPVEKESSK